MISNYWLFDWTTKFDPWINTNSSQGREKIFISYLWIIYFLKWETSYKKSNRCYCHLWTILAYKIETSMTLPWQLHYTEVYKSQGCAHFLMIKQVLLAQSFTRIFLRCCLQPHSIGMQWIFVTDRNGLYWSLHWSLYWASTMQLEHMKRECHFLMTTKTALDINFAAFNLIRFGDSWIFVTDRNGLHWLLYCNKSSIWKESHQHLETPRRELIDHARTQRNSKRIINSRFRTLLQKCSTTTCPPY